MRAPSTTCAGSRGVPLRVTVSTLEEMKSRKVSVPGEEQSKVRTVREGNPVLPLFSAVRKSNVTS